MSSSRVIHRPRLDATPEGEAITLASIYEFILRCGAERRAAEREKAEGRLPLPDGRDDTKGPNA